ncbi:MAG: DUF362 domain-containing protein [Promethearchaeota archaeon]
MVPISEAYHKYRVTDYKPNIMKYAHNKKSNKYFIAGSVLKSDIVIHLPKLKCHRKAGITACLKNNVGINGHKDWLPHHRKGSVPEGGDEYLYPDVFKRMLVFLNEFEDKYLNRTVSEKMLVLTSILRTILRSIIKRVSKDPYLEGSWYGNNTLWRTILDLNKILLYAEENGKICSKPQRKRLYLVDGIHAGDQEGPLSPRLRKEGLIIFGTDPAMIDLAISELIGFDFRRIPSIYNAFKQKILKITNHDPKDLIIKSNVRNWNEKSLNEINNTLDFIPSKGWKMHVEKYKKLCSNYGSISFSK